MFTMSYPENESALANFREYLRIPSMHPNVDYDGCVAFLKKQALGLGLPVKVFYVEPKKPIVVITWDGSDLKLPAVLLNSHMDVVPVFPDKWTKDPFGAEIDENGNIYARGTQDMKCVGIQYLEAIRRLKNKGIKLQRTIHVSFVPDEEIGGIDGMKKFVHTSDFLSLNVGFALDEGMANPTEAFTMFYGERSIWNIKIKCPGSTGHGSSLMANTAGEKVHYIIDNFAKLRAEEKAKLEKNPSLKLGDVTTVNLTQTKGGVQPNVLPEEIELIFDVRLDLSKNQDQFEKMIQQWCKDAGCGVTLEFIQKTPRIEATKIDCSNPWWLAFKKACDELGINLEPQIFPAATDSRYLRQIGLPALGFSPMNNTPILLHDHDEFLNENIFLRGIEIYEKIIAAVANVKEM